MKICLLLLLPSIGPCLFPAIWVTEDSQLLDRVSCALLHSTTSVSQKQYPAFSAQMEVRPYASRPLSFYLGNQLYTSQGSRRSTERLNGSRLRSHLGALLLLPTIYSKNVFQAHTTSCSSLQLFIGRKFVCKTIQMFFAVDSDIKSGTGRCFGKHRLMFTCQALSAINEDGSGWKAFFADQQMVFRTAIAMQVPMEAPRTQRMPFLHCVGSAVVASLIVCT